MSKLINFTTNLAIFAIMSCLLKDWLEDSPTILCKTSLYSTTEYVICTQLSSYLWRMALPGERALGKCAIPEFHNRSH